MKYRVMKKSEFLRRVPANTEERRAILTNIRRVERERAIDVSLSVTSYFAHQRAEYQRGRLRDYYRRRASI